MEPRAQVAFHFKYSNGSNSESSDTKKIMKQVFIPENHHTTWSARDSGQHVIAVSAECLDGLSTVKNAALWAAVLMVLSGESDYKGDSETKVSSLLTESLSFRAFPAKKKIGGLNDKMKNQWVVYDFLLTRHFLKDLYIFIHCIYLKMLKSAFVWVSFSIIFLHPALEFNHEQNATSFFIQTSWNHCRWDEEIK